MSAREDRIDLWITHPNDPDARALDRYRSLLPEPERRGEHRFVSERDRRRYLVTRALVRTVLSRYAPFSPDVWRFTSNEHGKPEIAGHDVPCDLRFNVAHSEDVVLLAVSRGREVGVDVEALGTGNAYLGVAERFFARTEMGALQAQRRDAHAAAFLEFWTLKEAYVKARGRGLSLALDSFAFALGADIEFSGENSCADADARWWFSQLLPAARYVAAVCAETDVRSAPTLTLRRVVPLGVEQLIECAVIRQSRMND